MNKKTNKKRRNERNNSISNQNNRVEMAEEMTVDKASPENEAKRKKKR